MQLNCSRDLSLDSKTAAARLKITGKIPALEVFNMPAEAEREELMN